MKTQAQVLTTVVRALTRAAAVQALVAALTPAAALTTKLSMSDGDPLEIKN